MLLIRPDYYSYFKVIPGFRVYIFGSSPFPVSQAAEVERGMSCLYAHF
jgi:hypothetical protein